jgi:sugar phosphate permease
MNKRDQSIGGFRSIMVWGSSDIYFIESVMIAVLFGILSPNLQKQLHLDSAQLGLLGSVFFISYGVAQLFAGGLMDSLGPRLTLAVSSVIATCGLFLLSVIGDFKMAIPAQLLMGVGLSTSYVGAIYLAGTWFPPERFSFVSGVTQMSANIMTAALVLIMALSGAIVSFRIVMRGMAFVTLAVGVLMFLFVRSAPVRGAGSAGGGRKGGFAAGVHRIVRIPQFWLGTIYFSASFGVLMAFSNLWNIPDQLAYGHSIETAASLNALLPLGGAFGAILAGWIADYLGRRALVAKVYICGMLVLGAVLIYGPDFPTALAFLILVVLGFFFGGSVMGFPLVGQYVPSELQGSAFGLMATIAYLLSALLQYMVGALITGPSTPGTLTAVHDFKLALTPLVVTLAIGFVCSRWLRDSEPTSGGKR